MFREADLPPEREAGLLRGELLFDALWLLGEALFLLFFDVFFFADEPVRFPVAIDRNPPVSLRIRSHEETENERDKTDAEHVQGDVDQFFPLNDPFEEQDREKAGDKCFYRRLCLNRRRTSCDGFNRFRCKNVTRGCSR